MRVFRKTCSARLGTPRDYLEVLIVILGVTAIGWFTPLSYHAFGYVYLLAVIALSLHIGLWPVLVAVLACGVAWNFVFVPPRMGFAIPKVEDAILLTAYVIVALVGNRLAALRSADERARLLARSEQLHQTLLNSVSHELKTPIAVFQAAVEDLESASPSHRRELIGELRTAGQRLDNLVTNLLSQTRLESGVLKARLDWCDGGDLVAAARRSAGSRLEGRSILVDLPADYPLLLADAALMEQVIAQLLLNAALYTPAAGRIWIRGGASASTRQVFLSVSDEGPGVPDEIRETIFDKFHRGPTAAGGGLGLGLSIVRGFMQAQGGEVAVDFPAAGGSRFTLSLPEAVMEHVPVG